MPNTAIHPEDLPQREIIDTFFGVFRFLSNFSPSRIKLADIWYPTVEHAYQASKTTLTKERRWIAKCPTPGDAKQSGQHVTIRPDWEDIKVRTMGQLLRAKFHNPLRASLLLATGDAVLIEENNWGDKFWGCEMGEGLNVLGTLLMEIREELKP